MIQDIKDVLQDIQIQQQIKESANLSTAIKLITSAGVKKGYSFTRENVAKVVSGLILEKQELTESELLSVGGGLSCTRFTSWDSIWSFC